MYRAFIKNYRFWVLFVLASVAFILIISEPTAEEVLDWWVTFIVTKIMGLVLAVCTAGLFSYWAKRGKIDCLTKLITEE